MLVEFESETHSPDIAVSSSDHPVLIDQGTSAEMESVGLLGSKKKRTTLVTSSGQIKTCRSYI